MTCESCGVDYQIGQWYQCPHEPLRAGRGADVTWPGGRTFENLADTPQTFYSPNELRAYLKRTNQEEFVRHVPVPGSDKSPHTVSWAAVSQYQMDGARAMLERVGKGSEAEPPTWIASLTLTETVEPGYVTQPIEGIHVD